MRAPIKSGASGTFNGRCIVPAEVCAAFDGATISGFKAAYRRYHYADSLRSRESRRRIARDVVDHLKSRRTWFPYYVLYAAYACQDQDPNL